MGVAVCPLNGNFAVPRPAIINQEWIRDSALLLLLSFLARRKGNAKAALRLEFRLGQRPSIDIDEP